MTDFMGENTHATNNNFIQDMHTVKINKQQQPRERERNSIKIITHTDMCIIYNTRLIPCAMCFLNRIFLHHTFFNM